MITKAVNDRPRNVISHVGISRIVITHTAATRLVGAHIPLSEVGRVLGHTQANTTYRYINANVETAKRAAAALDAFNAEAREAETMPEVVH